MTSPQFRKERGQTTDRSDALYDGQRPQPLSRCRQLQPARRPPRLLPCSLLSFLRFGWTDSAALGALAEQKSLAFEAFVGSVAAVQEVGTGIPEKVIVARSPFDLVVVLEVAD